MQKKKNFKWSEFNVWTESPTGSIIIQSLRTQEVVEFTNDYKPKLKTSKFNSGLVAEELREFYDDLFDLGLIVYSDISESDLFLKFFHQERKRLDTLKVVFTPTLQCQAACFYCWQPHGGEIMGQEIADLFIIKLNDFFTRYDQTKKLFLELFGGEPLLAWKIISYTLPRVQAVCDKHQVELETSIISNTELMSLDKAKFLFQFNWQELQTTFDGPQRIHDQIRTKRGGQPTFQNIYKNFAKILESSTAPRLTKARCHFYPSTISLIPELFDQFIKSGFNQHSGFRVSVKEVQQTNTAQISPNIFGQKKFKPLAGQNLAEAFLWLYRKMALRGLKKVPHVYQDGPLCYEKQFAAWVVAPDGIVESCDSMVGTRKGYAQLDQLLPILNNQSDENFAYLKLCNQDKCSQRYTCGGSCTYNAMVETGQWRQRWCRKEYLEKINSGLLRLHYVEFSDQEL